MKLDELRQQLAHHLVRIEEVIRAIGLPMTELTLIARDPANDDMYVCVTSEDEDGLNEACRLALRRDFEQVVKK